jgi:hypothetical protein
MKAWTDFANVASSQEGTDVGTTISGTPDVCVSNVPDFLLSETIDIRILTDVKERPKRRLEFWIAKDQHRSLQALEEKTGASIAAQIRIAIDEYLEKRKSAEKRKERVHGDHRSSHS